MKVASHAASACLALAMASGSDGFGVSTWGSSRAGVRPTATVVGMASYLDQLDDGEAPPKSFYEPGRVSSINGQPMPPPPPLQYQQSPPPPQVSYNYYSSPPGAQNNAVAPQGGGVQQGGGDDNALQNIAILGVAVLGLPLWLLTSSMLFKPETPPPPVSPPQPAAVVATPPPVIATPPPVIATPPPRVVIPSDVSSSALAAASAPTDARPAGGVVVLSQPITKAEVRALFGQWNDALHTLDPATVARRYSREGVLLPTLSDIPRSDFEGIKDYFVHFLEKKPDGKILEGDIFVGNNWAQDAGIYEFSFADGSKVKARYSFVYVYEDGKWMISHHHSSLMPEEVVRPVKVTETQVRGLFNLWNDALATGDPQKVADRYTSDAVLLPTLSDEARYTNDRIADYFVGFLQKKPVGRIVEGNVKIGPNWAQDAGIYEFAFKDGSTVQGRYSFVYAYENGEWKISNHHSSIMPEGAVAAMKKVASMGA